MEEPAIDLMLSGSGTDGLQLLLLRLMFAAVCAYGCWRCWQEWQASR
jgi:hypothetical protein